MTFEELQKAGAKPVPPSSLTQEQLLALGGKPVRQAEESPVPPSSAPARPRRGDELTQPDPSPAPPVTAPTPRPLVDVTGSVARSQDAIRKGAPGEDLSTSEARAHDTEEQNNPVKDDWLAKEIISGVAGGPVIGKAIEGAAPLVKRGLGAVAESSAGRQAGRAFVKVAEGAKEKLRQALGEVGEEGRAMLKEKPWLAEGRSSKEMAQNFATEGKSLETQRAHLLELADTRAAGRVAAPGAVEGEAAAQAPVGAPLSLVAEKVDAKIAKLAQGTRQDREAAVALKAKKDELLAAHGEAGAIPATKLRQEMSDYQTAFDKTASAASTRADKEMSKALGDTLRAHVDDPELQAQIDALTDKMSVTTRAEKALTSKAKAEAAPGGAATGHGMVGGIVHDITHAHSTLGTAVKVGKRIARPVASAADSALGAGARGMSAAVQAVVKRGIVEHWTGARLAKEILAARESEQ